MPGPLAGLHVLDLSTGMPGAVLTMLLADYGADVLKIEEQVDSGPLFVTGRAAWQRGKKSVELDVGTESGRDQLHRLISGADILVETASDRERIDLSLTPEQTLVANPQLLHCTVSGYGYDDTPWRDLPAGEALVGARMGVLAEQPGHRTGPIFLGHPSIGYTTGLVGAIGVLTALHARRTTGLGQHIDVSALDGVLGQSAMNWWFTSVEGSYLSSHADGRFGHLRLIVDMFQCADGEYLMVHTGGRQGSFKALMTVLGVGETFQTIKGPEGAVPLNEVEYQIAREVVPTLWASKTRDEWLALLLAADVAAAPVLRPGEALADAQVTHSGLLIDLVDPQHGPIRQVGPGLIFSATKPEVPAPAPRVGQHNDLLGELVRRAEHKAHDAPPAATDSIAAAPFAGLKVLDLSTYFATAFGAKFLSDYGADVIKVEALESDPMRALPDPFQGGQRGKRAIALDLKTAQGKEIIRALVQTADVVMHNQRPGAAERLGIGYEQLKELNPRLIYCYQPGWGSSGPRSMQKNFYPLLSAFTGMLYQAAGEGNAPVPRARASEDYYAGLLGVSAVLMALDHRAATGEGQYVECSQLYASLFATNECYLDAMGEVVRGPALDAAQLGISAFNRLYRLADGWACVSATTSGDKEALLAAVGAPRSTENRDDVIAANLEKAFESLRCADVEAMRDEHGVQCEVAAELPFMGDFLWLDWALDSGRVFEHADHPSYGYIREIGLVFRLSRTPGLRKGPAPFLGEHTVEILRELGYAEAGIAQLERDAVVVAWKAG